MAKVHKDFRSFAKKLEKAVNSELKRAASRSINRALTSTKAKLSSEASKESGAKVGEIKKRIGTWNASSTKPSGAMVTFAKPMSLSIFSPKVKTVKTEKGKRQGVTVKLGSEKQLVPGGFLFTKKHAGSKIKAVFARIGQARLPIKKLFTNFLAKIMLKPSAQKSAKEHALKTFEKNFTHELERKLKSKL